mgnify:CR=1 FL=1
MIILHYLSTFLTLKYHLIEKGNAPSLSVEYEQVIPKLLLNYLQNNQNTATSAKSYFLQELRKQNRPKLNTQQLLGTIIPLAALGLTLIAIILLGPKVGELLKASLLSLNH